MTDLAIDIVPYKFQGAHSVCVRYTLGDASWFFVSERSVPEVRIEPSFYVAVRNLGSSSFPEDFIDIGSSAAEGGVFSYAVHKKKGSARIVPLHSQSGRSHDQLLDCLRGRFAEFDSLKKSA